MIRAGGSILLLLAMSLALCPASCQRDAAAGAINIDGEDFGSGIRLGISREEAAAHSTGLIQIQVVTADELAQSNPFGRADQQRDLVLAVYRAEGQPGIQELRCYAAPTGSLLTLQGQPFASLSADSADTLLQQKGHRSASGSETHADYEFAAGKNKAARSLRLSFRDGAGCYAARLQAVQPTAALH